MGASYDDFIRTTEPRHYASCAALWRRLRAAGDIYLGHYEGWYAVRDEAYYGEDELTVPPDGSRLAPSGAPVEWVREPSYFFRLSAWRDRLLRILRRPSRGDRARVAPQRGDQFRPRRAAGSLGQPHQLHLGHPGAGRSGARDVCVARRADQLHHRLRLPGRDRRAVAVLAGRPARGRQGNHPLPLRLLARLPDGGRHRAAEARVRAWLVDGRGPEDEQVARQRDRAGRAGRRRFGLDPLRYFLLREVPFGNDGDFSRARADPAAQRRTGERSRQPGPAHAVADRAQLRRAGCRARRAPARTMPRCWPPPRRCPPWCASA